MVHVLFTFAISLFAYFFYLIQTWQLSILCGLIIIFYYLFSYQKQKEYEWVQMSIKDLLKENWLFLARLSILTWIWVFMHYFLIDYITIFFVIIIINLILRLGSLVYNYKDWEYLFRFSYFLSSIILLIYILAIHWFTSFWTILFMLFALQLAIFWFIYFIIWYRTKVNDTYFAVLYTIFHLSVAIFMINLWIYYNQLLLSLIISQLYFFILYYITFVTFDVIEIYKEETKPISAEDILKWAKVLAHRQKIEKIKEKVIVLYYQIIKKLNNYVFQILSFVNIIIIIWVIGIYIQNLLQWINSLWFQILYWFSVIIFIANFIAIKKTPFKLLNIHRFFVFITINFVAYINFFFLIWQNRISDIVLVWTIRNFVNAIAISQSKYIFSKWIFEYKDYYFRILANILSMIVNIILLLYSDLPWEIIFASITFYIWLFWFLTYYNINYIYNLKNST